jgi:hypothetical protein
LFGINSVRRNSVSSSQTMTAKSVAPDNSVPQSNGLSALPQCLFGTKKRTHVCDDSFSSAVIGPEVNVSSVLCS